jgi:hypothetical protein
VSIRCALSVPPPPVRSNRHAGYETVDRNDQGGNVAESHHRGRSWATIAAFALIIAVNIGDGIDDGFSVWDWILIALGVVFIVQAASRLRT